MADRIAFDDPDAYVEFLRQFGYEGVGFSGGEPLIVLDKLLLFISKIKKQFGSDMYVWIFTNGDLANERNLSALRDAGLDEIRFNISARGYDLKPITRACKLFDAVTVEIPAIPEDYEMLRNCLPEMARIGVTCLNLHQLTVTKHNYRNLTNRNYTIIPCIDHEPVVYESERDCLRLLKYASDERLALSVNYCSAIFKQRCYNLTRRGRAAVLARTNLEKISDAGYLASLSVTDTPGNIDRMITSFRKTGKSDKLWSITGSGSVLAFHPDLLDLTGARGRNLTVRYFMAEFARSKNLNGDDLEKVREFLFSCYTRVILFKRFVAGEDNVDASAAKALLEGNNSRENGGARFAEEKQALDHLYAFARMDEGFPEVLDSKRYWGILVHRASRNTQWDYPLKGALPGGKNIPSQEICFSLSPYSP